MHTEILETELSDQRAAKSHTAEAGISEKVRAAEYVRMSTDHQKFSTENQSEVIRKGLA